MKVQNILSGALALALVATASADVTVHITGATAFRTATLDTIKARFLASTTPSFKFGHDKTGAVGDPKQSFNVSTRSIFKGTFPGVAGVTTIKATFTGSVEGIRAATGGTQPTYLVDGGAFATAAQTAGGTEVVSYSTAAAGTISDIAFSDVGQAATPVVGTLAPSNPEVGVVTFVMIANEASPAGLTNVTTQNFRALMARGFQPLRLFTGLAADTARVYATGRNDGSGTRTTYLAESGYGVANRVNQYFVSLTTAGAISQLTLFRAGSGAIDTGGTGNISTIWPSAGVDGNGGYSSGGNLVTELVKPAAASVVVRAFNVDDGAYEITYTGPLSLVTAISTGDALTATTSPEVARVLGYNGSTITPISTGFGLSPADEAKVTEGQYTLWSFQRMYRRSDIADADDRKLVYDGIRNNLNANLGATGIPISSMHVTRPLDGGVVAP